MAEIEGSLLAKVEAMAGSQDQPVLIGFLRPRKKRIGTLIEAVNGQSLKDLKREIKRKGGKKIKVYEEINTIYAEMPVDRVKSLTSMTCAQKIYDAEGNIEPCLNESVPLVMGVEKWQLPYRFKHRKLEGNGVKVAVIDSGIDKRHPDFAGRIKKIRNLSGGRKYKGTEHGTHVAGIIAASGKASLYKHIGVAPKVDLYIAKVFIRTHTTIPIVLNAIRWAIKRKVNIINMSLGQYSPGCTNGTCPVCRMSDYAASQGITVVVAAGNDSPAINCPGNARQAITVGATTKTSPPVVSGFSARGHPQYPEKPDLVAPGEKIAAPQPGGYYRQMSGTSMATPHVTGLAALLYQSWRISRWRKGVSPAEIKQALKLGTVKLGDRPSAQGSGLVNFKKSLEVLYPPKPSFTFLKKLSPTSSTIPRVQAEQDDQSLTCPALMEGFCPHYKEDTCQNVYKTCIYYQAAMHSKLLQESKIDPLSPASSEVIE